jgi:glycosyltransferase involved in cell wall biosynthesis
MTDPLVLLSEEWEAFAPEDPRTSGFVRRISGPATLALLRHFVSSLADAGADVISRRSSTPDLLATRGPDSRPLGIELKVWGRSRNNFRNLLTQAISASVAARRAIPSELTLDLVIVLLPDSYDNDWLGDEDAVASAEGLLRQEDGVGYDNVFLGVVGPLPRWIAVSPASRQDHLEFDGLKSRLAQDLGRAKRDERAVLPETPTVLMVADEWGSGLGGISTFNRSMAIGLAANGFSVGMLLPSFKPDELEEASAKGIALFQPDRIPGVSGTSALLGPATYGDDFRPNIIIGHGRKLGPHAFAVQKSRFPEAKRLHIVHTHAEALESVKGHLNGEPVMVPTEQKRRLEIELAESADLVAGVGPLLARSIRQDLRGSVQPPEVIEIVPELPDWGQRSLPLDPPPNAEILIVSRTDDVESKGIEFAVRAMNLANAKLINNGRPSATLVIRGVQPEYEPALRERLEPLNVHGTIVFRPYSPVGAELRTDYFASTTVLLPSRHEGFGLSAFEAMGVGVPVLVSARSGLGETIQSVDPVAPEVLPVDDASEERLLTTWADAIAGNVLHPGEAFGRAARLHALIAARHTWSRVASQLRAM